MRSERAEVSVVIPCYLSASTVGRAIESVIAQTSPPAEIIIIEDASPDCGRTLYKIQELQNTFGNLIPIRLLARTENVGPAGARNDGWNAARHPYVAFLDADDTWHPKKIEIQYQWMQRHLDVAISGHKCLVSPSTNEDPELRLRTTRISKHTLLLSNRLLTPSVMLRRDIPFRFREVRYCEDYMLWLEMVCKGEQAAFIHMPLAYLHKPNYGHSGLSAQLWAMEQAELRVLWGLRRWNCISLLGVVLISVYSLIKFAKRVVVVAMRRTK